VQKVPLPRGRPYRGADAPRVTDQGASSVQRRPRIAPPDRAAVQGLQRLGLGQRRFGAGVHLGRPFRVNAADSLVDAVVRDVAAAVRAVRDEPALWERIVQVTRCANFSTSRQNPHLPPAARA
jgi:hypothetical protein